LVENEPVDSGSIHLELLYPENEEESIDDELGLVDRRPIYMVFLAGYYFYLIFLSATGGINSYLGGVSDSKVLGASIVGTAFAYGVGRISLIVGDYVSEKSTIVREHKHFAGSLLFLLAVGGLIVWTYSLESRVPPVVVTYIPASIGASVAYARYMKGESG